MKMTKCDVCNKGNNLRRGKLRHAGLCSAKWRAEHIPKNQKPKRLQCPICYHSFDYWQKANLHAWEKKHWGDYTILALVREELVKILPSQEHRG